MNASLPYPHLVLLEENRVGQLYRSESPSRPETFLIQTLSSEKVTPSQQISLWNYLQKSQHIRVASLSPVSQLIQPTASDKFPPHYIRVCPPGERLSHLKERWSEDQILGFAIDLLQAFAVLHEKNLVFGPFDASCVWIKNNIASTRIELGQAILLLQGYPQFFWAPHRAETEPPESRTRSFTDGRADIYRLGILLIELFSRQKVVSEPPKLIDLLRCTVPLKNILQKMIAPSFLDRYSNAIRVLKDLQLYLRDRIEFKVTDVQEKPFLLPQFVGREAELDILQTFIDSKTSKLVLFSGISGIGKNHLADSFLSEFQLTSVLLKSEIHPYQGIYGPFRDLLKQMAEHPRFQNEPRLKTFFQRTTLDVASSRMQESHEYRLKIQQELGDIFFAMASRVPLILYFSRLQYADEESLLFIRYLLRCLPSSTSLQIYATLDQEEESLLRSFLSEIQEEERLLTISLYGLDTQATSRLLSSLLGMNEFPVAFARKLNESAEGSPLFLTHLLLWMIENKTLFLKESYWEIDIEDLDLLELPEDFKTIFSARYSYLDTLSQTLFILLTLSSQALSLNDLATITQQPESLCWDALLQLQKRLLVFSHSSEGISYYGIKENALRMWLFEIVSPKIIRENAFKLSSFFAQDSEKYLLHQIQQKDKNATLLAFHYLQKQQSIHSSLSLVSIFEKIWIALEKPELQEPQIQWICRLWNEWEQVRDDQKSFLSYLHQQIQQTPERYSASIYLELAESFIHSGDVELPPKLMQQARKKGALLSDLLFVEMKYHLAQENYEEAIKFGESLLSSKIEHPPLQVYLLLGKAHKQLATMEKLAYEDSQDNFESLIQAGEEACDTEAQRIGYYELAKEALPNRPQEAQEALISALKLGNPPIQLSCQLQILSGFTASLLGQLNEAITAYEKGSALALQFGLYTLAIEGTISLASTYRELGRFVFARQALDRAEQYLKSSCKHYEFLLKLEKARLHLEIFDLESALDLFEEWDSPPRFSGIIQDQHFLHSLEHGHVFLLLGDSAKALKQFNKAISLLNPTKDWLFMACAFMYIGAVHIEDQDSKKATIALSKAESLARLLNHPFVECWLNYLHGLNSMLKENSFLAKKFFAKAEKTIEQYPNLNLHWRVLTAFGKVLLREGQLLEARQKLEKAKDLHEQILQELSPEETLLFQQIPNALSLQKSLEILKKQHHSNNPSPKKVVEAIKHRLAQTEIDEDADLELLNKRLKTLFQINEKINSSFNEEALALVVETGIQLAPAERGFLLQSREDRPFFHVTRNHQKQAVPELEKQIPLDIIQKVLKQGTLQTTISFPEGSKAVIYLPLQTAEKNIGILGFDWATSAKMPVDSITLLQALASQAAIALENIELYQRLEKKKNELARSLKEYEKINQELQKAHENLADKVQAQRVEIQEIQGKLAEKQHELEFKYNYDHIIGQSPKIREIFKILDKVIDSKVPVLIHGESGTGKELIARAIHFNGERRKKNFCAENCAALSDSLLESELFGYVRGAFTGAVSDRKGLFEIADQGTLFLDEVGDMSLEMQKKLLRVLQENEIRRLGSKKNIPVNVRLVSATHRDLRAMTAEGLFREDLYYRLNVVQIKLPPLRERPEDIPFLFEHFLKIFQQKNLGHSKVTSISQGALELLQQYSWPGNIRELQNIVMSAVSLAESEMLTESDFEDKINRKKMSISRSFKDLLDQELSLDDYLKKVMESCQAQYNDTQLAQMLGLTRKTLWQKRKSWGLDKS